jgi:predicted amidohydrolase
MSDASAAPGTFRIALASLPYPGSPEESIRLPVDAVAQAGAAGAGLVCFPECYVPGYRAPGKSVPPHDPAFLERAWSTVAAAARAARVAVILGTERRVAGALRISALVLQEDGAVAGWQDKVQLDPSEDAAFTPGAERHLFRTGPLTFGISICHEGWRYPETVRWAAARGAQVVFHPHYHWAEPGAFVPERFADPRSSFHEKAVQCRAAENTVYFASVNCAEAGAQTTSAVAAPDGSVVAWQPYGKPGLLVVDLDLGRATGLLARRWRPSAPPVSPGATAP